MSKGKKLETFITSYKYYSKEIENKVNKKIYLSVLNGFAEYLMSAILEGECVHLPSKLGAIEIIGKKLKPRVTDNGIEGLTINWQATKKLWKECEACKQREQRVYYFNEHSDGVRYRYMWSRNSILMTNKYLYTYVPNRKSKAKLFKKILEGKEYLLLEGKFAPHSRKIKNTTKDE
jgi:hypothetical protein